MSCRTTCYLFIAFLCCANMAAARAGRIYGRVNDEAGKPLPFAGVILLGATDSALVKAGVTNDKGEYDLTPVPDGGYLVKIMFEGLRTWQSGRISVAGNDIEMPVVNMEAMAAALKEVAITAQKPFIEAHADRLVVNVDNSIVAAGASVMEVLQQSPGVTVDQNDNVSLKGRQGVNIMIDGRLVPVTTAELANMLKSMPANTVDKIEIISNPPARYDAAGTAGIINIKTKKDNRMGINGSVNAGYGQGVYDKENAGANLNFRDKKLNIYASYNASYRTGFSHVNWNRKYYTAGGAYTGAFIEDNNSVLHFRTHMASAGADYALSGKTTIGASVSGEKFFLGTKGYYFNNVMAPDNTLQSYFATNNTSAGNWYNYAPNVHLKHTFDSLGGELNIDADYAGYHNSNNQDFTTRYYDAGGSEAKAPYVLHGDIAGTTRIRSLKADYTEPLSKNARVDAGFKASLVTADNKPDFYDRSNGGNVYDSTKSDHFIYNESIMALYLNTAADRTKWSTQMGLRAEQTIIMGNEVNTGQPLKNNYLQLFPSIAVQNHINKNNDLGLTLSRRIERPEYNDLNPYRFFVDPTTYRVGNPYLNPALTYAAELSHVYKQRLITTLSYSETRNVITEVIKPSTVQDRVTIQTKDNLATMRYIGVSGAYTLPIGKWWTSINIINAYYSTYQGNLANTPLNAGRPTMDINTTNKFLLPGGWSAELSFFYQAAQVYGFLNLTPVSMLNAGIQKTMLDKQLTIKLNAHDIFYDGNESGSSYFTGYKEVFVALHDTRQLNLSVTYRFGKKTVALLNSHNGGAEEEKKRAGSQAG